VILASLLLWSCATLVTGVVSSFWGLLAARLALGVSEAFYMPAAVALIVEYHSDSTRSRATGLHLSGVYAGSILGGCGGWMADEFGWRFAFLLFGGVGVAYALVLMIVLPQPVARDVSPSKNGKGFTASFAVLLSTSGFLLLLGMNLLNGAAYWPLRNWLPTFFSEELGVDPKWAGLFGTSSFNAAAFVGMLLGSNVSDWWVRRNPRARPLVPAIGFLIAAPWLFTVGAVGIIPVILVGIFFVGMSQGFLDANLMPAACTVTDPQHRATAYGLLNFVGTTAGGVMTFIGGVLKDEHIPFSVTFQVASGFILVAGLLLFLVKPRPTS
jgi:predicted MFS family arabinose efflux permease